MKDKMMAMLAKLKSMMLGLYAMSPLAAGIVIGYFGKPIIKMAVDVAAKLMKMILG